MGFSLFGDGGGKTSSTTNQYDYSDNSVDESIHDHSVNSDAGESVFNFGSFFNTGSGGGGKSFLKRSAPAANQSANIMISDASADVIEYAGDLAGLQNDALYYVNDVGNQNLEATLDFAGGVVGESMQLSADSVDQSLSFGRNLVDEVIAFASGSAALNSKNNLAAQDTVMSIASESIRAADETTNERTTNTALYTVGFVVVGVAIAWSMKH